jgi:AcrR family transcriptional regulator
MRSIAQQAGVDPALIAYFFGSKRGLFNKVMRLPIDPPRVVARVLDGERTAVGERLATVTFEVLADQHNRDTVIGLLRSASHDREAATLLRVAVTEEILKPIASALDVSDADLRAELALSQDLRPRFRAARDRTGDTGRIGPHPPQEDARTHPATLPGGTPGHLTAHPCEVGAVVLVHDPPRPDS